MSRGSKTEILHKTLLLVNYCTVTGQLRRTSYTCEFYSYIKDKIQFIDAGSFVARNKKSRHRRIKIDAGMSKPDFFLEVQRYLAKTLKEESADIHTIETMIMLDPSWWIGQESKLENTDLCWSV